ncbi:hypothetical protein CW714_00875 [Methanophagales archaeon]|nr:MAG: hypothetical protein CW714_00875 [Methanophagales archaeon]
MGIKAEFVLEDEEEAIKTVYESIKEEKENKTKLERFFVDVALKEDKLSVCIRGEDIVKVRAAANTWLRLLKVAEEMVDVVKS